jgi:hypothetical protein
MTFPAGFPDRLIPLATAVVLRVKKTFPQQEHAQQRIRTAFFELAEIACTAAKSGEWRPDLALSGLEEMPTRFTSSFVA